MCTKFVNANHSYRLCCINLIVGRGKEGMLLNIFCENLNENIYDKVAKNENVIFELLQF